MYDLGYKKKRDVHVEIVKVSGEKVEGTVLEKESSVSVVPVSLEVSGIVVKYKVTNVTNTEVPVFLNKEGKEVLERIQPYRSITVETLTKSIKNLASNRKRILEIKQE